MTSDPQRAPISGARRAVRIAVAAGLVAALSAAGPIPLAVAAGHTTTAAPDPADPAGTPVKSGPAKLGSEDADLLARAKAKGNKTVTMMVATAPGKTEQVAGELDAVKGGSVGRAYDKLGYVRATVPTAKADAAIAAATELSSVHAIDLRQEIALDDPTPGADTAKAAKGANRRTTGRSYPAPDRKTPPSTRTTRPSRPVPSTSSGRTRRRTDAVSPSASSTPAWTSATRRCSGPPPASGRSSTG